MNAKGKNEKETVGFAGSFFFMFTYLYAFCRHADLSFPAKRSKLTCFRFPLLTKKLAKTNICLPRETQMNIS